MTTTFAPAVPRPAPTARRPLRVLSSVLGTLGAFVALAWVMRYAVETGLPAVVVLKAGLGVALTQILTGAVAWRAVRPRDGWLLEDLIMGFAVGSTFAIGAQIVAGTTQTPVLSTVLPFVPAVALMLIPVTRRRVLQARFSPLPWWFGVGCGALSLAAMPELVTYFARDRLRWPSGAWLPHNDLYLHLALAAQLKHRGPTSWPTVAGEDLGYHYFAHAWIAQTSAVSGVGLDDVLLRFMPAAMPIAVVLATAVAALRLSGRPLVGVVAGLLAMAGGQLNVFGLYRLDLPGMPVEPYSPTLALGGPTLMALTVLLAMRWRGQAMKGALWLVPVLAIAAAGTKGSTLPIVVAGLALAAAAMLVFNRSQLRGVLVDLVLVGASLVFAFIAVFHGSSAGLAFGLPAAADQTQVARWLKGVSGARAEAFAIIVSVLMLMSRGAMTFALPFSPTKRRDPLTWLLVGATLSGAGAVGVFSHPGLSQLYFALTAIPLMAVGSALGLERVAEAMGRRFLWLCLIAVPSGVLVVLLPRLVAGPFVPHDLTRARAMVAVACGLLLVVALLGALLVRGGRLGRFAVGATTAAVAVLAGGVAVFVATLLVPPRTDWGPVEKADATATTQAQIDPAIYIRHHSGVNDLVMTNRHCNVPQSPFTKCDSRRWVVTAFSERQSLIEGWTATPKATRLAPHGRDSVTVPYWHPEILRLNDGFIAAPTTAARKRLWDLGVRWVYVDYLEPHATSLAPYATLRYRTSDAAAWQLNPPG